eukprot:699948-Pelagomonas_calceolata.AAC.1
MVPAQSQLNPSLMIALPTRLCANSTRAVLQPSCPCRTKHVRQVHLRHTSSPIRPRQWPLLSHTPEAARRFLPHPTEIVVCSSSYRGCGLSSLNDRGKGHGFLI